MGRHYKSFGQAYYDHCWRNAEFERDLIRDRTSAGRLSAKKRGVIFGRPKKLSDAQEKVAQRLLDEGKSVKQVADTFEVHESTIYRMAVS
jgi:DNA invertase Pin-like site-specific DNA recombinase